MSFLELQGEGCGQSCAVYDKHGHYTRYLRQMRECQADSAYTAHQVRGARCLHESRVSAGDARSHATGDDTSATVIRRGSAYWCK